MAIILVTGASGFVGKNLIPYLQQKQEQIVRLSLRDSWQENIPGKFDAIVHLAGKAHDTKGTSEAGAYFQINTELTRQLFDIFIKSEARDFIYFSSVKAVADTVDCVLYEDVTPDPRTPYGQSKCKAEQYLLAQPLPQGKRLFIMRPCMIHGPGNKGNLNLLYKFVAKGIPYPLAAFENKRSFLSVSNLCYAVHQLIENVAIPSGIYNLADDEALSTNDVVRIIAGALHKKPRLLSVPKGLLNSMASIGDTLKLPLNKERLKKLTEDYRVSNEKIKNALGISSFPIAAREGLQKTIESFHSK